MAVSFGISEWFSIRYPDKLTKQGIDGATLSLTTQDTIRREPCSAMPESTQLIPGTVIFDGREAMKGYALNRMCYSFNEAANRQAFLDDEEAYCTKYGLSPEQREAVRQRNVLALTAVGGNIYYLAKLAGTFGLGVQDLGAQQTGVSVEEFKARLVRAGQ